ncbi:MAG: hypothetical protein E6Q83_15055 [Thiothrix sp.]|nr:MAG: hypothetical protein E6Q83_15055 [Thiothrix sp.]
MLTKFKFLLLLLLFIPAWTVALAPPFQVSVDPTWQAADPKDVQAVLDSTILSIAPYIGNRRLDPIVVKNEEKGPISLYERDKQGKYIILLDVNGRYWSQLAYQFSHETCHLLSNYDLAPNNLSKQQWFEESLCEAFSLFSLGKLADQWDKNPPYPNWKDYAPELRKYLADMLKEDQRSFAPNLASWYQQHKTTLEADPYADNRRLNEKFASHLLKIFSAYPEAWAAINYMNLGDDSQDKSLTKYLKDWHDNAPANLRAPIQAIQQQLGLQG